MNVESFLSDIDLSDPSKIEVVLSGFVPVTKKLLMDKLIHLGFRVDENWTTSSNILVTDRVFGSEKYTNAAAGLYPIVQSDWIKQSFIQDTPLPLKPFLLPPLKGLAICVSQLRRDEREQIKEVAERNGATYNPSLHDRITHLVLEEPTGPKFEYAKKLRKYQKTRGKDSLIAVVTKEWFEDSVRLGYAQSPHSYLFPEIDMDLSNDVSLDTKHGHILETQTMIPSQTTITTKLQPPSQREELQIESIIDEASFLDSCHVFLFGFSSSKLKEAHEFVAESGAHLVPLLQSHDLTHVVLQNSSKSIATSSLSVHQGVHIVTYEWLINSCKLKSREPEHKYSVSSANRYLPATMRVKHETIEEREIEVPTVNFSSFSRSNGTTPNVKLEKRIESEPSLMTSETLFCGLKFFIDPSLEGSSNINLIVNNGGIIMDEPSQVDYYLADWIRHEEVNHNIRAKYVNTIWLKVCLKEATVKSMDDESLYKTIFRKDVDCRGWIRMKDGSKPRFTTINTKICERYNFGKHIIEALGGEFEAEGKKSLDYLVCGTDADSKKYQFCQKIGTIVPLNRQFLIDSALSGHFVDPALYPFRLKSNKPVSIPQTSPSTSTTINIDTKDAIDLLDRNNGASRDAALDEASNESYDSYRACPPLVNGKPSPGKSRKLIINKPDPIVEEDEMEDEDYYEDSLESSKSSDSNSFGSAIKNYFKPSEAPQFTQLKTQFYPSQEEQDETNSITRTSIEKGMVNSNSVLSSKQKHRLEISYGAISESDRAYNSLLEKKLQKVETPSVLGTALSTLVESQVIKYDMSHDANTSPLLQKKVFLVSGQQSNKQLLTDQIAQLNGEVVSHFDSTCTHLVISELSKTEKFLSAVAAQLLIVHPTYVERSVAANRWLPEDDYLFMPPSGVPNFGKPSELYNMIQRQCLSGKPKAFSTWIVHLELASNTRESFERIFLAGGATVLNTLPESQRTQKPTHVIYNGKNMNEEEKRRLWKTYHDKEDLTIIVTFDYVAKYLVDDQYPYETYQLQLAEPDSGSKKRKMSGSDTNSADSKRRKTRSR